MTPGAASARGIAELLAILRRDYLTDREATVRTDREDDEDGRLLLRFGALSTDKLGLLLATLSGRDDLGNPESLGARVAIPALGRGSRDQWRYGMGTTRFADGGILITMKIRLPYSDLPEVITRLSPAPAAGR